MKKFINIFFTTSMLSGLSIAQSYLILQSGTSLLIPMGSQFCSDNIIVETGARYTTETLNGTCENAVISGDGVIALPIELISFSANTDNRKYVLLIWETATEVNNYGFELERSNNKINWKKIAFVIGHGNSNAPKQYSYTDNNLTADKYYYRLKQIDSDGSFTFSKEIVVLIDWLVKDYNLEQNYPNPFNPITTIGFRIKEKSNVRITLLNMIGEEINLILNEEKEQGYHEVVFNAENLTSGVYFYRILAGDFFDTKKMMLVK